MHPTEVFRRIGPLPYMKLPTAHMFYEFILHNSLRIGLELGFFHGMSSAYLAGALEELDGGHLTTIDIQTAMERTPNIEWVMAQIGLTSLVDIFYEPRSFNWRLMKFLAEGRHNTFSFCYLDGAHKWDDTGLAFCVVQKLLAPRGWVVFDDIYFTFRESNNRDKPWVRRLPEAEQVEPQVQYVFELLVEADENFCNFRRLGGRFAFAQKKDPLEPRSAYLPKQLDIAVSRVLERAHLDPDFRQKLFFSPHEAMRSFLPDGSVQAESLRFEESGLLTPLAAQCGSDGVYVIPVERAKWEVVLKRSDFEDMLGATTKT